MIIRSLMLGLALFASLEADAFSSKPRSLSFSPDFSQLVTNKPSDYNLRIWDPETGAQTLSLSHQGMVNSWSYNHDGRWIISGSDDGHARLWDPYTGLEYRRFTHIGPVKVAEISGDSKTLITMESSEKTINIWDIELGALKTQVSVKGHRLAGVNPSGDAFYTLADNESKPVLRAWRMSNGSERAVIALDSKPDCVLASPDGKRILAVGKSGSAFDAETGSKLYEFEGTCGEYDDFNIVFSHDGEKIAVTLGYETRILNAETGALIIKTGGSGWDKNPVFSPDDSQIHIYGANGRQLIYETITGRVDHEFYSLDLIDESLQFGPRHLATYDGRLLFISGHNGSNPRHVRAHPKVGKVLHSPSGKFLAVVYEGNAFNFDCRLQVFDAATRARLFDKQIGRGTCEDAYVMFNFDESLLLVRSFDDGVTAYETATFKIASRTEAISVLSPDKKLGLSVRDSYVRIIDMRTLATVKSLSLAGRVSNLAFTSNSKALISFDTFADMITVWSIKNGKKRKSYPFDREMILSPDGRYILDRCRMLEAVSGKVVRETPCLGSARFNPDGRFLFDSKSERSDIYTTKVYHFPAWNEEARFEFKTWQSLLLTADSQTLVSYSKDGLASVWSMKSAANVMNLRHSGEILSASLAPDRNELVTASGDGALRFWSLDSGTVTATITFKE